MIRDYKKILAWQEAHALAKEVYWMTAGFPAAEQYGLTSQLRRSALSVPTNIVEGSSRATNRDYAHFLNIAWASLKEVEYLLLFAADMGFLPSDSQAVLQASIDSCCSRLAGLTRSVRKEIP
jgi:four helix bundle protein